MAKRIVKGALSMGGLALGLKAGKALFGGGKKKAAEVPDPVMPIADDVAIKAARKKSIIKQMGRGGRSSTILTDGDSLGG